MGDAMKLKTDDVLIYKNTQLSSRYGTGVVTLITADEYAILWSGRGLTRYKRAILDRKLDEVFQRAEKDSGLPKERHLHLGATKTGIPFNENYDRAKIALLCEGLKSSGSRKVKDVADLLAAELITKKLTARGAAKGVLLQLADLCHSRSAASDEAQNISRELFFGYVLQKSDFKELESSK
jgi:hypothetical protein